MSQNAGRIPAGVSVRSRLGCLITAAMCVVAAAQGHSRIQGPAAKIVTDGVYTDAQATRGKTVSEDQCAICHSSDLAGQGFAPPLIDEPFKSRWQGGNLGDLFIIVQQTMPQDKPASLTDQEYAEIVAYVLKSNRYPAGEQELGSDPAVLKTITFKQP